MTRYKYIGDIRLVSPCMWLNNHKAHLYSDSCNNGSCPGYIAGHCCFCGDKLIEGRYFEQYFEEIEEE